MLLLPYNGRDRRAPKLAAPGLFWLAPGDPAQGDHPSARGGEPAGAAPRHRGGPARGVDVKPLRPPGPEGQKRPKKPPFGLYPAKTAFLAIFAENSQKWLFFPKNQLAS